MVLPGLPHEGQMVSWHSLFRVDGPHASVVRSWSEQDKTLLVERVRENDQGIKNPKWNHSQFKEAMRDPFMWQLFSLTFLK